MDRREFAGRCLSFVALSSCAICQRAKAEERWQGCSLAVGGSDPSFTYLTSTGDPNIDLLVRLAMDRQRFGVKPKVLFFDDANFPNGYASPKVVSPADGPDGTIYLGATLLNSLKLRQNWQDLSYSDDNCTFVTFHEMGHILQYKRGMPPSGPWQMEPHADFLAGWAFANSGPTSSPGMRRNLEDGTKMIFSLGDTMFNDRSHHGEPQFRAAMLLAGFDAGSLSLDAAFAQGKRLTGLT